jgi:hypothetical protein
LLPGSEGRPTWNPETPAERSMIKLPTQFREIFTKNNGQLDEEIGAQLATWAAGGVKNPETDDLVADYAMCQTGNDLTVLEERREKIWKKTPPADKQRLKEAAAAAKDRLFPPSTPVVTIALDQATIIRDHLREEIIEPSLFCAHFEIGDIEQLPADKYQDALKWIELQVDMQRRK